MKLLELPGGDKLHHYKKSLVLCFAGPRDVLSTGPIGGGFRADLQAVFNNDCNPGAGMSCELRADTYEEHMELLALTDLGLNPKLCTGLSTAASMDHVAIRSMSYDDFTVTAIVTGGIRVNGSRVGDPAVWHEKAGISHSTTPGTINIILHIDAALSPGALARALVTCTEAKTAALQELLAPSRYSHGIATGSGTDGTILVANPLSSTYLTNAGKHCKLGEYIGKTVREAVKEALNRQSGLCPASQHDIRNRMDRFGVTEDKLWAAYRELLEEKSLPVSPFARADFTDRLERICQENTLVTYTSLYAHLLDQLEWGLLTTEEAFPAGQRLLELAGLSSRRYRSYASEPNVISQMAENYLYCLADYLSTPNIPL